MKTKEEIEKRIVDLTIHKKEIQHIHDNLCQIDMLSGKGSEYRRMIAETEGGILLLNWVLKN